MIEHIFKVHLSAKMIWRAKCLYNSVHHFQSFVFAFNSDVECTNADVQLLVYVLILRLKMTGKLHILRNAVVTAGNCHFKEVFVVGKVCHPFFEINFHTYHQE